MNNKKLERNDSDDRANDTTKIIEQSTEFTSPQWILDQRQKSIERERNASQVNMVGAVSIANSNGSPPSSKKRMQQEEQKKPSSGKANNRPASVSSYWESQFNRDDDGAGSTAFSAESIVREKSSGDLKAKARAAHRRSALEHQRPPPDLKSLTSLTSISSNSKSPIPKKETTAGSETKNQSERSMVTSSSATVSSLPGAFSQTGVGMDTSDRRDSAIEEVAMSIQQQEAALGSIISTRGSSTEDIMESGALSVEPSVSQRRRSSQNASRNANDSSSRSLLVKANLVTDAETIFYAEDVQKENFRRKIMLVLIVSVVVVVIVLSLVFGLRDDDDPPPPEEDSCAYDDKRCCDPEALQPLPNSIPLRCRCFNSTAAIYNNLTANNLVMYDGMLQNGIINAFFDRDAANALDRGGCDPIHQIMLTSALFDRWGISFDDLVKAPIAVLQNVFAISYIFVSMGGIDWHQSNGWWENAELCDWFGVDCIFLDTLSEISIPQNNLHGTLPTYIGKMATLRNLDLSGNAYVTGRIPSEIALVTTLKFLDLSNMSLNGTVPSSLGSMDRLDHIALVNSGMTGTIPTEIFKLPNIRFLALSDNRLHGTVPSSVGQSTSLNILQLHGNDLTGSLPTELALLTRLELLDIGENELVGTIPEYLGRMGPTLELINVFQSGLIGTIPETFCSSGHRRLIIVNCTISKPLCSCCSTTQFLRNAGNLKNVHVKCGEDLPPQAIGT